MRTTLLAAQLLSRMRPDEGQLSVELAVLRHIYVCNDVNIMNMILIRCLWILIAGNDSIQGNIRA